VPGGIVTILVGTDREPVESVITKVAALLAVGSPLIIVLVVVGTYRLVGAALGPVEAIRAQVAQIVRSHGGAVAVGDAAAGGAVFTLTLPLAQQDSVGET